mmetsp:Transcript_21970/g.50697  ORF Transcript_21970/g.50697 Transcript_21970/m.50697 type:complete len:89 (-) Transcript_21970:53-319(-)
MKIVFWLYCLLHSCDCSLCKWVDNRKFNKGLWQKGPEDHRVCPRHITTKILFVVALPESNFHLSHPNNNDYDLAVAGLSKVPVRMLPA